MLSTHDGRWVPFENFGDVGSLETVYNLRIAEVHTYFVGGDDWGFSVWVHNAYRVDASNYQDRIADLYGGPQALRNRRYLRGDGTMGEADRIALINGKHIPIEAKFVGDWASSLRNPKSNNARLWFAKAERRKMLSQVNEYLNAFDEVIYHSNNSEFITHYSRFFKKCGVDVNRVQFVLTP